MHDRFDTLRVQIGQQGVENGVTAPPSAILVRLPPPLRGLHPPTYVPVQSFLRTTLVPTLPHARSPHGVQIKGPQENFCATTVRKSREPKNFRAHYKVTDSAQDFRTKVKVTDSVQDFRTQGQGFRRCRTRFRRSFQGYEYSSKTSEG